MMNQNGLYQAGLLNDSSSSCSRYLARLAVNAYYWGHSHGLLVLMLVLVLHPLEPDSSSIDIDVLIKKDNTDTTKAKDLL